MQPDLNDNGYKSRKMVMSYVVLGLILVGFLVVGQWSALTTIYSEYVMGVLAASSIYAGTNTLTKWVNLKNAPKAKKAAVTPPPVPPPPAT